MNKRVMKKKILIAILVVMSLFVILGISLYGYLKSDHAKNMIVKKINELTTKQVS